MCNKWLSNTMPELTEKEGKLLSLSHDKRWLESQIELFSSLENYRAVNTFQEQLDKVNNVIAELEDA